MNYVGLGEHPLPSPILDQNRGAEKMIIFDSAVDPPPLPPKRVVPIISRSGSATAAMEDHGTSRTVCLLPRP